VNQRGAPRRSVRERSRRQRVPSTVIASPKRCRSSRYYATCGNKRALAHLPHRLVAWSPPYMGFPYIPGRVKRETSMFARPPFANPPDMFASSGMLGDRFRPSDKHFRDVFVVLTRTSFDVSSRHGNREAKRGSKIASNVWRTYGIAAIICSKYG